MAWVAAATLGSALIGSQASKSASNKQSDAANRATDISAQQFETVNKQQKPYREIGYNALSELSSRLGLAPMGQTAFDTREENQANFDRDLYLQKNPDVAKAGVDPWWHWLTYGQREAREFPMRPATQQPQSASQPTNALAVGSLLKPFTAADLQNEPGYQFGLNQGQQAIDRSAAARGGLYSGATAKALTRFGQDYGGTKFDNAFNRDASNKTQAYNFLARTAGLGEVANAQTANAGSNYANNAAANAIGAGNASAANALNQGNIWGNAINGLSAYGQRNGWFGGGGSANAFGGANSAGFGSGAGFGNQDLGQFYSDARLKTNMRPIGRTARGNTIYAWDWKTGGSGRGVIAQEVEHIPGAVSEDADGLLMVDYSRV